MTTTTKWDVLQRCVDGVMQNLSMYSGNPGAAMVAVFCSWEDAKAFATGTSKVVSLTTLHDSERISRNGGAAHLSDPGAGYKRIIYGVSIPDPEGAGVLIKYRSVTLPEAKAIDESIIHSSNAVYGLLMCG